MALSKITADSIAANAVTANSIGYTPANKAGDTFTGAIIVNTTNGSPPFTAGRVNSDSEGGQIDFCRSSDNAAAWGIDVYGNSSTPSLRFIDNSASATRMQIDSGGRVTMPNQPNWCVEYFGIAITAGATTTYTGGTVYTNNGSYYAANTGRFTAPVAGYYLVSASVEQSTTSSTAGSITINKNGAAQHQGLAYGAIYNTGSATGIVYCAVNDYITISSYGNNGLSYNVYTARIAGHLIG